nr:hypothetical protein CFP56_11572 [Quercus suber]
MSIKNLSSAQCSLLAIHYASLSDIKTLHAFTPSRNDVLPPDLVLRILLTYLPEALEPSIYATYAEEVATRLYVNATGVEESEVDISPVADLTDTQAQKKVKNSRLLPLRPASFPSHAPDDLLTLFLVQRAKRIDEKTGLLGMVPQLIEPHLHRNEWIRSWYISVVLPLVRMQLEYYSDTAQTPYVHLDDFEKMAGRQGVDLLLHQHDDGNPNKVGVPVGGGDILSRDLKSLVGPWMYGHTERKRRKLSPDQARNGALNEEEHREDTAELAEKVRKISLSGVKAEDKTGHDWEYVFDWLVSRAHSNFPLVTRCIEDWDGPGDVDLGGFQLRPRDYLDDDLQTKLELQYGQTAFAICYAAQGDTKETISGAHGVLARLAELLDFIPPPDLATSVDALPQIERHATRLDSSQTVADLAPDSLLSPEHPLTSPRLETYMLLQMMVYSAYQLSGLGHPIALVNVAKLHFYATADDQLDMLKKILRTLAGSDTRKDESQWAADRAKLMWLWNWGIDSADEGKESEGAGVLGKIDKKTFETQMLETFVDASASNVTVEDVNPLHAGDALGGKAEKELSFPFVATADDLARVKRGGMTDGN